MKYQLKQTVIAILTATTLFSTPAANASGIPTVDGANIAQGVQNMLMDIMNHAETITQWTENFNHLKTQIQNQIDTLNAIKNVDDLDSALNAIDNIMNMPDEWKDIYATVQDLDPTGELKKLKFDPDLELKNRMTDLKIVEGIQKGFKESKDRLQRATDLLRSANSEIALQKATALIMAEQTRLQQAQFEYNMLKSKYEADEKANRLKFNERSKCATLRFADVDSLPSYCK